MIARKWSTVSTLCAVLAAALALPAPVRAQGGYLMQGLFNVEGWGTDADSRLLARGNGHPSTLGRLDMWAALEPIRNVILFGEALGEAGSARIEAGNDAHLKQAGVRFIPSERFSIEAGKITQVVGTFSSRVLSTRNPLIGTPYGYAAAYPNGIRMDGNVGIVDYRAGVVSLPVWRDGYTPTPSKAWRPAAGIGLTPTVGLRFGLSGTVGSYLNDGFTSAQLKQASWDSYKERVLAWDAQFSHGYFEAHAEGAFSSYDVPGRADAPKGTQYYLESKYTLTPRVFAAARFERNDYPFIANFGPSWVANNSVVSAGEIGAAFRPTAETLVKLTFRRDHWGPTTNPQAPHNDGHALAVQYTQSFDIMELLSRNP